MTSAHRRLARLLPVSRHAAGHRPGDGRRRARSRTTPASSGAGGLALSARDESVRGRRTYSRLADRRQVKPLFLASPLNEGVLHLRERRGAPSKTIQKSFRSPASRSRFSLRFSIFFDKPPLKRQSTFGLFDFFAAVQKSKTRRRRTTNVRANLSAGDL